MSLGGYKFEGRYSNRGSLTDTEWCLQIHKTRIAAFMAANARANAGWTFDYSDGQLPYGTSGNVIYRLDELGYNYVTTFKNGNDAYFHICSFFYWTSSTSSSTQGQIALRNWIRNYTGTYGYIYTPQWNGNTLFHRIGCTRTEPDSSNWKNMSQLIPAGSTKYHGTYDYAGCSSTPDTSYTFFKKTSYYAGYAVKGKHIISIQQCEALDKYAISILTADPYSTMFNPDSPVVKFGYYCFIGRTESASNGEAYIGSSFGSTSMDYEYYTVSSLQLLNKDSLPTSSEYFSYRLIPSPISVYYPPVQEYPFSAITAIGTSNLSLLKTSGIGNIYIDLLSWNCVPYQQSNFNMYEAVANGNYLTIGGVTISSGGTSYMAIFGYTSSYWNDISGQNQRIFCGWDSSNPDITLTSAWEEYTE